MDNDGNLVLLNSTSRAGGSMYEWDRNLKPGFKK